MNCIDADIIQRYIDGETNVLETEQIEKHIADCSSCADQIEERKAFAKIIKTDLQKLVDQPVEIPCWATVPLDEIEEVGSSACLFFL